MLYVFFFDFTELDSPIIRAIAKKDIQALKQNLQASRIEPIRALSSAASLGNKEVVQLLVDDYCADPNLKPNSVTILATAAGSDNAGREEVIRFLLDKGANVDARDKFHKATTFWFYDSKTTNLLLYDSTPVIL